MIKQKKFINILKIAVLHIKNNISLSTLIKSSLALVLFIGTFFCIRKIHANLKIEEIVFDIDYRLTSGCKKEIKEFTKNCINNDQQISIIAQAIKDKFSYVESVDMTLDSPHHAHITIKAYSPLYQVNHNVVWTLENKLLNKQWYKPSIINSCNTLYVHNDQIEKILIGVASKFPVDLIAQKHVTIKDLSFIVIKESEQDPFEIICSIDTIPTQDLLNNCCDIKNNLIASNKVPGKPCQRWMADIRFKDQIIVQAVRGK